MNSKTYKIHGYKQPVEKHETAPISNIQHTKSMSDVTVPSDEAIEDAKEWVDINEK